MKARHVTIIAKKEFHGLFSEKTILLAVLLQLFIALFSSFLMVGLTSMYDPTSLSKYSHFRYDIAYAGNESPLLRNLVLVCLGLLVSEGYVVIEATRAPEGYENDRGFFFGVEFGAPA